MFLTTIISSILSSPYTITAALGYSLGFVAESCIWRCRLSRWRWMATAGVLISGCFLAGSGVIHEKYFNYCYSHQIFSSNNNSSSTSSSSLLSYFLHTLTFISSWTFINTIFDFSSWAFFYFFVLKTPKSSASSQRSKLISRVPSVGKNLHPSSDRGYPKLIEYKSKFDLPLILIFTPLTATFLSMLMIPGVILLCAANAISPPRPVAIGSRTKCLHFVYPKSFVDDQLCVIPALPESNHPIVWIVNKVMEAAMSDNPNDKDDDDEDLMHPEDISCPPSSEAGAFALFNMVFSTMSNKYFENRKKIFTETSTRLARKNHNAEGNDDLAGNRKLKLHQLATAPTTLTCFEAWSEMAVHECVHVRQQMLSTSVMSFLAIYLGQYFRNAFRKDTKEGMGQAYLNTAAEKQAYSLESYDFKNESLKHKNNVLKEKRSGSSENNNTHNDQSNNKTIDEIVEQNSEHIFPVWGAIRKDFYYQWY